MDKTQVAKEVVTQLMERRSLQLMTGNWSF